MKTRTPPSSGPQAPGNPMEALKHDVAALMTPLQEVWGEIRKEFGSGEKVKAAVHESGLDQTWNQLKQAAATVVQPWLPSAQPQPTKPRRRTVKKAVRKTTGKVASKVARKVSAVKKKVAKKAS